MRLRSKILMAKVMHKRLIPRENVFSYRIYYLGLVLSELYGYVSKILRINRWGLLSFYEKDHNNINNSTMDWIIQQLSEHNLDANEHEVMLVSMPRVLGYVFNPVSFWLCTTSRGELSMVVCEVCNTFGEKHNYVCLPAKGEKYIKSDTWLYAHKIFHVSPFLERSGEYEFLFNIQDERLQICINAYNEAKQKVLITSLTGTLKPLSRAVLNKVFWTYPLVTIKAIALIHFQAMKLMIKKVKYRVKPKQRHPNISNTY